MSAFGNPGTGNYLRLGADSIVLPYLLPGEIRIFFRNSVREPVDTVRPLQPLSKGEDAK